MIKLSSIDFFNNLLSVFDVGSLIRYGGLLIIFLVVYGTTGLFFCFFKKRSGLAHGRHHVLAFFLGDGLALGKRGLTEHDHQVGAGDGSAVCRRENHEPVVFVGRRVGMDLRQGTNGGAEGEDSEQD